MTIKKLTTVIIIPVFVITLIAVWKYFDTVYYSALTKIETEFIARQTATIDKLISATTARYGNLVQDWGIWDDAYNYVITGNPEFVRSSLVSSSLRTTDTDMLMITDLNLNRLASVQNLDDFKISRIISALKKAKMNSGTEILCSCRPFFILPDSGKPYMIAVSPVSDSKGEAKPDGYFIAAVSADRFMNSAFSNAGFISYGNSAVAGSPASASNVDIGYHRDRINLFVPFSNSSGSLRMSFDVDRQMFRFVDRMLIKTIAAVMLIFIFASTIITLIMYFGVFKGIYNLTQHFHKITQSKDYEDRLPETGIYELKLLAHAANTTLDDIVELNGKLALMASIDELTGIPNRRSFDEALDREFKNFKRNSTYLSFIMIDIDNFKKFNDDYGHQTGDVCLRTVAGVIKNCLMRPTDFAARYGGEEFAVILPDTDSKGAMFVAERICYAVASSQVYSDSSELNVTVSIGVCSCSPLTCRTKDELVRKADSALYEAKQSKNSVILFRNSTN